jgi:hypothetical protein
MAPFLQITNALRSKLSPRVLVILEAAIVLFLHITEDYELNDLLHITQISSKWKLAPFYKTGAL